MRKRRTTGRPTIGSRVRSGRGVRRVKKSSRQRQKRSLDPSERKARNRTVLALGLLAVLNLYVFVWRDDALSGLGTLSPTSIVERRRALPALATPRSDACGGNPVRIFEGLEDLIVVETNLAKGATLRLALLQVGIEAPEIDRLERDVRRSVDLGLIGGSGAPVRVATDRDGGIGALEIELAEGRMLQACRRDAQFEVRSLEHPLRSDVEVIGLRLGRAADLSAAVEEAGEKPELAHAIAELMAHQIDFLTEARPDDVLQVMVEKRWLGRQFHRYGPVLAVRLRAAAIRTTVFRYKPQGASPDIFDRDGHGVRRKFLRSPVAFFRVDADARAMLVPSLEVIEGRVGASYRVPEGARVVALAESVVHEVGETLEQGKFVDLRLPDGTVVRYCHLSRLLGELNRGVHVAQGQRIGLTGHTGHTSHDRLRVEIWSVQDGTMVTIDPLRIAGQAVARPPAVGDDIPDDARARFDADTQPWLAALRAVRPKP